MNKIIYPTNGEIINTITNYISDSIYKYAVLIDGDWGSGKTWFIKNILMPKIDEYCALPAKMDTKKLQKTK